MSISISSNAQVPQKISIQGILTDDSGEVYPDNFYDLTFRLYNQKTGGIVAWQETQQVESKSGLFNALMGEINPLDISFNHAYFLGITVDGGSELEPRIEMAAVAYSLIAKSIEPGGIQLGGLGINSVDVDNIIPNIVSSVNGVTTDGGNIQLVAGSNITISPDDVNNTITISASDQNTGNSGILQINGGNSININDSDGPTTTVSVALNSINDDEIQNNSISASSLATGSVGNNEIQDNAVNVNKISNDVLSSIDGVRNDGGNVDLIAGANITITPNDVNNSITISAANQGGGNAGILQINPGNAIDVSDIDGPTTTIGVRQKSIGTNELESVVTFGAGGIVDIENPNGLEVSRLSYNQYNGGFLGLKNSSGIEILRLSNTADNSGSIDLSNRFGQPTIGMYNWLDKGVISIANSQQFEAAVMTEIGGFGFIGIASPSGQGLAAMEATDLGDGIFSIYNNQGNLVAQMTEDGFGNGYLGVQNSTEAPVVSIYASQPGDGLIQLNNRNLALVAELTTSPAGGGQFQIGNVNEAVVASVKEENGAGYVGIADATETAIAQMHQHAAGIGAIEVMANGIPVAQMTRDPQGNGKVGVFNTLDVPMGGLETEPFGGGFFFLSNSFGNEVVNSQSNQFGGEINLFNDNTAGITTSAFIATGQYGGSLGLQKADGANSIYLGTNPFDRPNMELFHANGALATNISSMDLEYYSQNGIQTMILNNPEGWITLNDDVGDPILNLGNIAGNGFLSINNSFGNEVVNSQPNQFGGEITLFNDNLTGVTPSMFMATNDLGGSLAIQDASGGNGLYFSDRYLELYRPNGFASIMVDGYNGIYKTFTDTGFESSYLGTLSDRGYLELSSVNSGRVSIDAEGGKVWSSGMNNSSAHMQSEPGGGVFNVFNSSGLLISEMSFSTSGGGYLQLNNSSGVPASVLSTSVNAGGYVGVNNKAGVNVARLTTTSSDDGYLSIIESSGNEIVGIGKIGGSGVEAGGVFTYSAAGAYLTGLSNNGWGDGYIRLNNNAGDEKSRMTTNVNGGGFLSVKGASGNDQSYLSTTSSDVGVLQTFGPNGTENVRVSNSGAVGPNGGAVWVYDDSNTLRAASTANGFTAVYGTNGNRNVAMASDPDYPNSGSVEVYDPSGNVRAELYVNASGQGVVYADIKNFRMEDPTNESKEIWYASLEGPEAGAYTRGTATLTNGEVTIHLPEHFSKVAVLEGMTVQLTPLSADSEGLAVVEKSTSLIVVKELRKGKGNYKFDFIVHAVRSGFTDYEVVREKHNATIGDKPAASSENGARGNSVSTFSNKNSNAANSNGSIGREDKVSTLKSINSLKKKK